MKMVYEHFDKRVEGNLALKPSEEGNQFALDPAKGIGWSDKKRIKKIERLIKILKKKEKEVSADENLYKKVNELKIIYEDLLNYYHKHDSKFVKDLQKRLPKLDIDSINQRSQEVTSLVEHSKLSNKSITQDEYERRKKVLIDKYHYIFGDPKRKEIDKILIINWEDTKIFFERLKNPVENCRESGYFYPSIRISELYGGHYRYKTSNLHYNEKGIDEYIKKPETFKLIVELINKYKKLSPFDITGILRAGVLFLIRNDINAKIKEIFYGNLEKALIFLFKICKIPFKATELSEKGLLSIFSFEFPFLFGGNLDLYVCHSNVKVLTVKFLNINYPDDNNHEKNFIPYSPRVKTFVDKPLMYMKWYFIKPKIINERLIKPMADDLKISDNKLLHFIKQGSKKLEREEGARFVPVGWPKSHYFVIIFYSILTRMVFEILKKENSNIPLALYKERNLVLYFRYSYKMLIDEFNNLENTEKPFGVFIHARFDHNRALTGNAKFVEALEKLGYITRFVEARSVARINHMLKKLVKKYDKKISFLFLSVHGRPNTMRFVEDEKYHFTSDKKYFPSQESQEIKKAWTIIKDNLEEVEVIAPNAEIVSFGCSTGAENGILQKLSEYFEDRIFVGPNTPSSHGEIIPFIDENKNLRFEVNYPDAITMTYLNGKKIENLKADNSKLDKVA
ncbi:MAG: hypothetical protein ACTSW3_00600 [Promethearchaeota archaeon]